MTEALTSVNSEADIGLGGVHTRIGPNTTWLAEAACRAADARDFYATSVSVCSKAKVVCSGCPVKTLCLETALLTNERWGIWGGLTRVERLDVMRERGILVPADIGGIDDEFDDADKENAAVELGPIGRQLLAERNNGALVDATHDDARAFSGLNDPDEELEAIAARRIAEHNEATINAVFYGDVDTMAIMPSVAALPLNRAAVDTPDQHSRHRRRGQGRRARHQDQSQATAS